MAGLPSNVVGIWADGVCHENPGPGGWGALLRYGRHEREVYGGTPGAATNNRMDLTAPVEALSCLKRRSTVHLYTRSTYVRNGIVERLRDRRDQYGEPDENADLWRKLGVLVTTHDVRWLPVRGPAGNTESEHVDRLALLGLQEAESAGVVRSSLTTEQDPDEKCVHDMTASWCGFCRPPPAGVLPVGYQTRGGRAYHNDPTCDWLVKGHDRSRQQGKDVHPPTRVRWAEVATNLRQPCEHCCTDGWLRQHKR